MGADATAWGHCIPGVIPPGDGLVSIWHGTDHPTCADHLKSKPIIATLDAAYQIGSTSDSHGGYDYMMLLQVQLRWPRKFMRFLKGAAWLLR